jgi:hypothetical protein
VAGVVDLSAQSGRSKWRRLVWAIALLFAVAVAAWQIAKRAIDVEQYRPQIEATITEFTGLPVSIGGLQLALHPLPCLSAHEFSLGEGDFHAAAARLDIFPRISSLLPLRVEIARIEVVEPAITLPATRERTISEWRRVLDHFDVARGRRALEADTEERGPQIRIDEVFSKYATVYIGQDDAHPITGSITTTGIGGDEIALSIELQVAHSNTRAKGTLNLPAREGAEVSAELTITGFRPHEFMVLPEPAHAEWEARAGLSGVFASDLALAVEGSFQPLAPGALGGTFSGHARIAASGKTRADLAISGEGLEVQATARLFAGDRSRVRIKSARVSGGALAALLGTVARDPLELRGARGAAVEVRDLGFSIASAPRLTSGALDLHGVELRWRDAAIAPELRLEARAADGAIQIAELRGGPIDLRGTITPDLTVHRMAVELTGAIGVDEALLHALGAPPAVRAASGAVALEELRAEIPALPEEHPRYTVRAQLAGGSLRIESDTYAETISGLDARLTGDEAGLHWEARGVGAALGPITANAQLDIAMSRVQGDLTLVNPSAQFLRDESAQRHLTPVLRAYAGAPISFEVQRDADPPHVQRIRFERDGTPHLKAALVVRPEPRADPLRDLDVAADLPADVIAGFLPEDAHATGIGSLRVRRSGGGAGFFAEADLGGLGIADGDFLEKKAGEPVTLRVEGLAGAKWKPRRVVLAAEQGQIAAAIDEKGLTASDLDIDLAAFSFLLVDGARASGRLRGGFETATKSVDLKLVGVALSLPPDFKLDAADGSIAVADHDWAVRDLRVRGPRTDATLDLAVKDHKLRGRAIGQRGDADFVRAFLRQVDALKSHQPGPPTDRTSGVLALALDHVHYRRAEAERFSAAVQFDQDDIHVRNLAFAVGEGRVTGRVDVDVRDRPEPSILDLDLDFANLSRGFVDELLDEESRGGGGSWVGKLRFTAPLHDDLKAMMPDGSGLLKATGRNGTLVGRLGLATKVITVLRSTETLRMKFPTLRDEGIVFDSVRGELAMEQGKVDVRQFELDSTSYAMSATGELNFREDSSHVPIEVNAIRGLTTSFVERVPVAGDALKIVNVRLVATGSPYDMQVRVASIQDQLLGAGLAGPKAVINGVRDAVKLMRRAGGNEPAPVPETQPDAEIPVAPIPPATGPPAPGAAPPPK